MTTDGTIREEVQQKAVEHLIKRLGPAKDPSLNKIFDYSWLQKVQTDLRAKGWKPQP
jgi:hypothetical protein